MAENKLIQINLREVLAQKLGAKAKWVPGFVAGWLERIICQDEMNERLRRYYPRRGADFCRACIEDMQVQTEIKHAERLPAQGEEARVIFVCNHPLGGYDGVVLIDELSRLYGNGVRFVVNDLLMAIDPLRDVFLPINKHGRQSRKSLEAIKATMEGNSPVVVFPAGLVSRRGKDGVVRDLKWHKMFVTKALQYHRDVVPLHFSGENSSTFYNLASGRKRLGLKFNIEMIRLPKEALSCQGKTFTITVGQRVAWESLIGKQPSAAAAEIKEQVYALADTKS